MATRREHCLTGGDGKHCLEVHTHQTVKYASGANMTYPARLGALVKGYDVADWSKREASLSGFSLTSMPQQEAMEVVHHLSTARRYLEWGSGGSTLLASWIALLPDSLLSDIVSIESSVNFVNELRRTRAPIRDAESAGKLQYKLADVGRTVKWGYPATQDSQANQTRRQRHGNETQEALWLQRYVGAVSPTACCFDFILIDGRFREACALRALLLSHNEMRVLVHDNPQWPSKGRSYNDTLNAWYNFERQSGKIFVLRARAGMCEHATQGSDSFKNALSKAMTRPQRR